jgi:uncharacterized protein YegP (UPF0339 family)
VGTELGETVVAERIVYQRDDNTWGWRLKADDGQIVATDAAQGYENEADATSMADRIIGGEFKDAKRTRSPK